MIYGGNATVYVSNMDNAIRFYTEALGLELTNRFGNHWATVQAGKTLVIGLHPWNPSHPSPEPRGRCRLALSWRRTCPSRISPRACASTESTSATSSRPKPALHLVCRSRREPDLHWGLGSGLRRSSRRVTGGQTRPPGGRKHLGEWRHEELGALPTRRPWNSRTRQRSSGQCSQRT